MARDTTFHNTVIAQLKRIAETENNTNTGTGSNRPINVIESLVNGVTDPNVQGVSILFLGDNGSIDGVTVSAGMVFKFSPNKGEDTIGSIPYTVPNTGESKVIISYVR